MRLCNLRRVANCSGRFAKEVLIFAES